MGDELPAGYEKLQLNGTVAVMDAALHGDIVDALRSGTVHDYLRSQPGAEGFRGRGVAWAGVLPKSGDHVLVRRSAHGGVFAPLTGELFAGPARAENELRVSRTLAERGVPTPAVLGYVQYPAALMLCRIDVIVRFIASASDLVSVLQMYRSGPERAAAIVAAGELLRAMAIAGAEHPDINLRNVLVQVSSAGGEPPLDNSGERAEVRSASAADGDRGDIERLHSAGLSAASACKANAWVLDLDRVILREGSAAIVAQRNFARLKRSALKLRRTEGVQIGDDELGLIEAASLAVGFR
jgi:hypothetical protein